MACRQLPGQHAAVLAAAAQAVCASFLLIDLQIVPMTEKSSSAVPPYVALPLDMELVLKLIPMPADCNASGDIFGGWVMANVDLSGSVLPVRHAQGRVATVAVNEFVFKQPVRIGDILSFFAHIERVGRTSMTVGVEVYAERFGTHGKYSHVTSARLTYVALDGNGKPREVPPLARANAQTETPPPAPASGQAPTPG